MKKTYLSLVMLFSLTVMVAQTNAPVTVVKGVDKHQISPAQFNKLKAEKLNSQNYRGGNGPYWINFADALEYLTSNSGRLTSSLQFPDSTVVVTDGAGGEFGWWQHAMAQVFDPTSPTIGEYMDDVLFTTDAEEWMTAGHDFIIDSIRIYYLYEQLRTSVDTIIVHLLDENSTAFSGEGGFTDLHGSGEDASFKRIDYDYVNNRPDGSIIQTLKIPLTINDTASANIGVMQLAVNLKIPKTQVAEGVVGLAMSYKAGHPWSPGDTLREQSTPPITLQNPVNNFRIVCFEEQVDGFPFSWQEGKFNGGYLITSDPRYNTGTGWDGDYIPTIAFTAATFNIEHIYVDWLVKSEGAHFRHSKSSDDDVCTGQQIQFTDESNHAGVNQWAWDFGDGNSSTSQNPTHTYTSKGPFEVCLTSTGTNGSYEYCETYDVDWCSGIEDVNAMTINAYPNPANETIKVSITAANADDLTISVTDIQGRVVYTDIVSGSTSTTVNINTRNFAEGLYIVEVKGSTNTTTQEIVVSH